MGITINMESLKEKLPYFAASAGALALGYLTYR